MATAAERAAKSAAKAEAEERQADALELLVVAAESIAKWTFLNGVQDGETRTWDGVEGGVAVDPATAVEEVEPASTTPQSPAVDPGTALEPLGAMVGHEGEDKGGDA